MADNMQELKEQKIWMLWRWETKPDGRRTKVPMSVSGTGIHQYGKCDFTQVPTYTDKNGKLCLDRQFYQKNPNNKMELYIGGITNRFASIPETS